MRTFAVLGLCLTLLSCGDSDPVSSISFAAMVGDQPLVCGQTYGGLGAADTELTVRDFRFYVHNVRLYDASGAETAFELIDDGKWQNGEVALLDFEDGCGDMGNSELRTVIEGRVPDGDYVGIRFSSACPKRSITRTRVKPRRRSRSAISSGPGTPATSSCASTRRPRPSMGGASTSAAPAAKAT